MTGDRYKTPLIRTTLVLPSFIQTTLFAQIQLPRARYFQFLAPPLRPEVVVSRIISALEDDESRVVRIPWYSHFARIMGDAFGIVPSWLRDLLQWVSYCVQSHRCRAFGSGGLRVIADESCRRRRRIMRWSNMALIRTLPTYWQWNDHKLRPKCRARISRDAYESSVHWSGPSVFIIPHVQIYTTQQIQAPVPARPSGTSP